MKRSIALALTMILVCGLASFAAGQTGTSSEGTTMSSGEATKPIVIPGKAYWEKGGWNTIAEFEKETGQKIGALNEAPALAEMVKAGKLPSVDQRLPDEPKVQDVVEQIGQYGGEWRQIWRGPHEPWPQSRLTMEGLMQFKWDGSEVLPNLATAFEVSSDATTFTFHLRKGVKWSDGAPFTADDIVFALIDQYGNKELHPNYVDWLLVDGKPPKVEKIDDYTIKLTFAGPYGLFPSLIANRAWNGEPKHYMSQFHPDYADKAMLEKQAKDLGLTSWAALYKSKANRWITSNPERPTLRPWVVVTEATEARTVLQRNPYYWKVDPAGNQLPYIDRMVWDRVDDRSTYPLHVIAGEIDLQSWGLGTALENFPVLKENEAKGGYKVLEYTHADGARQILIPNYDTDDKVLLDIFLERKFRMALSHAINREEINELMYNGMGRPYQAALMPSVPYYSEKWATAFIEFDQATANKLLDEIGLDKRNADGWRLRPDGQVLDLVIECKSTPKDIKHLELVADHWTEVGLKASVKASARNLYTERDKAGVMTIKTWGNFDRQLPSFLVDARRYVPMTYNTETWRQWGLWYSSSGAQGKEPPREEFKELIRLYDLAITTASDAERDKAANQIIAMWADNIYLLGTVSDTPFMRVKNVKMRNVPEEFQCDWMPRWDHSSQFFFTN